MRAQPADAGVRQNPHLRTRGAAVKCEHLLLARIDANEAPAGEDGCGPEGDLSGCRLRNCSPDEHLKRPEAGFTAWRRQKLAEPLRLHLGQVLERSPLAIREMFSAQEQLPLSFGDDRVEWHLP